CSSSAADFTSIKPIINRKARQTKKRAKTIFNAQDGRHIPIIKFLLPRSTAGWKKNTAFRRKNPLQDLEIEANFKV
ncbi:MAG TPA: hypothetical protein VF599_05000, partial [Pyrinomonadaceae bacterium]